MNVHYFPNAPRIINVISITVSVCSRNACAKKGTKPVCVKLQFTIDRHDGRVDLTLKDKKSSDIQDPYPPLL